MIGLPHQPAGTESPNPPSSVVTMEPREGRIGNAFACERCRKHKVRCVPSDAAGICQRCQKARVECIEHVARRRPAKHRTVGQTPTRVAEIEKSLDKLSALVTATATSVPSSAPPPTLPPVTTASAQISELSQRTPTSAPPLSSVLPSSVPKSSILPAPRSSPDSAISFWESINETISGLGRLDPVIRSISVIHMQMLLDTYRAMADFFPFVTLPKDYSYPDLIQQRPMLMFAVLTVASSESVQLQLTLSREFRKVIMIKIMHGEKSLDLLQGLLVFIAWHHHYMDSQAMSVHMLLQMCVGIAGDLGLDSISTAIRSPLQKEDPRDREAKRAYLGCYYLVSNIGLLETGKPRSMSYSTTLRTYAADLASTWEHPSDAILPILIDTCQFMEDVEETLRNQSEQALVARSQLKRLGDKWDHIRAASKVQANDFKTLQWIQLSAKIYLYNVASSLDLPDRESTPWASGFQLSMRITCLRSIEQFLDNSMKLSSAQYGFLSVIDWLNLITTFTTLSKFALHTSQMPGWDPAELQLGKTFEYFRDQLSTQMPRPRDSQEKTEDAYERFRRVTSIMKMALRNAPGRASPNGSTFEIATGSGRTISLLQDLPLPKPNGMMNGPDKLPTPWKVNSQLDVSSTDFPWKFMMGSV